jgi:hypothetical protein
MEPALDGLRALVHASVTCWAKCDRIVSVVRTTIAEPSDVVDVRYFEIAHIRAARKLATTICAI